MVAEGGAQSEDRSRREEPRPIRNQIEIGAFGPDVASAATPGIPAPAEYRLIVPILATAGRVAEVLSDAAGMGRRIDSLN